jgi:hypothetical protein
LEIQKKIAQKDCLGYTIITTNPTKPTLKNTWLPFPQTQDLLLLPPPLVVKPKLVISIFNLSNNKNNPLDEYEIDEHTKIEIRAAEQHHEVILKLTKPKEEDYNNRNDKKFKLEDKQEFVEFLISVGCPRHHLNQGRYYRGHLIACIEAFKQMQVAYNNRQTPSIPSSSSNINLPSCIINKLSSTRI